ncbi:ABC transporter permease [Nocardioides sp. SYSU D00038]|uniref:ABC transporter permease n=1 Tax=Nocardioides sp. SYSU D00038 TaxID=2812554 RepID=UPI001966D3F4|nr:ABC transporter permease [Nocardioides sp. SYSU D00038]
MTTTTTPPTTTPTTTPLGRTLALARVNALLMTRNRLTLFYGVVLPLAPLLFLLSAPRGDEAAGAQAATTVVLFALIFPVYYNVLSLVVTRRDELVLKRLRTGETRDSEQLLAIALPGCAVALVVSVLAVAVGAALGQPLPVNPLLHVVGVLAACGLFATLAVWTAAWTRNAEAAQLTSMPVILLAALGSMRSAPFPDAVARLVDLTPGAAVDMLVRLTWYGEHPDGGTTGLAGTWAAALPPLAVLVAWAGLALWLARRSLRWEPRA